MWMSIIKNGIGLSIENEARLDEPYRTKSKINILFNVPPIFFFNKWFFKNNVVK